MSIKWCCLWSHTFGAHSPPSSPSPCRPPPTLSVHTTVWCNHGCGVGSVHLPHGAPWGQHAHAQDHQQEEEMIMVSPNDSPRVRPRRTSAVKMEREVIKLMYINASYEFITFVIRLLFIRPLCTNKALSISKQRPSEERNQLFWPLLTGCLFNISWDGDVSFLGRSELSIDLEPPQGPI